MKKVFLCVVVLLGVFSSATGLSDYSSIIHNLIHSPQARAKAKATMSKPFAGATEYSIKTYPQIAREIVIATRDNNKGYWTVILQNHKAKPIEILGRISEFEAVTLKTIFISNGIFEGCYFQETEAVRVGSRVITPRAFYLYSPLSAADKGLSR